MTYRTGSTFDSVKWRRIGFVSALVGAVAIVLGIGMVPAGATSTGGVDLSVRVLTPATSPRPVVEVPLEIPNNVPLADVTFTISLSGLEPYSYVQIFAHSEPVLLASGTADASGTFTAVVDLPPDLPPGDHSLSVQNTLSNGTTVETTLLAFAVSESGTVGEPSTPLADGALSLVVPANAAASFGAPTLQGNTSITAGTLGRFAVDDQRIVSMPGWTLTASVQQFTLSTDVSRTIPASELGVAPAIVDEATTSLGVSLGSPTVAGAGLYPMIFAQSSAGAGTGVTTFDGSLVLRAPGFLPVGTYTSTFTLTLASK